MASTDAMSASLFYAMPPGTPSPLREAISALHLADEARCLAALRPGAQFDAAALARIKRDAMELVRHVRQHRSSDLFDSFLSEYDLGSEEGVILMCLAEALLRIPDPQTASRLIKDKLSVAHWDAHMGKSDSLLVNASTWGLMLTGKLLQLEGHDNVSAGTLLQRLLTHSGEAVVRQAMNQAMHLMAHQFVLGRDLDEAQQRAQPGYLYSYDMLGEAALTAADAQHYLEAYHEAIATLGRKGGDGGLYQRSGISVKLSALHPRYEYSQRRRVLEELAPSLLGLAQAAREAGITLTLDAEEARRLELSLDLFERVYLDSSLGDWGGLGVAVQAYQKRAPAAIDYLAALAQRAGRRIPLRLVKGAYWDSEIKAAQQQGLDGFPVFTRKANTDVAYLACARQVLRLGECFYPQFATHNAYTVAAVREMAGREMAYEFQRLHGMGEALFAPVIASDGWDIPCRVYAPVGSHRELLPYLVRRLLENGANTSFVNRINDERIPLQAIVADPLDRVHAHEQPTHPRIALPLELFGPTRRNSRGLCFDNPDALAKFETALSAAMQSPWHTAPIVDGERLGGAVRECHAPHDRRRIIGTVVEAGEAQARQAMSRAAAAFPQWRRSEAEGRAAMLEEVALQLEGNRAALVARCVLEGGRTVADALADVREAIDACRYYAGQARVLFAEPLSLPGPAGEDNRLRLQGRGVFACISPWNFPVAIFTAQIAAALAAGNCVVAKPATATPLCGGLVVELMHQAGIPPEVLHFVPGLSGTLAAPLMSHPALAGVAFTGSSESARQIARTLAEREGSLTTLIAETGGLNAMMVDSSALPEQVVNDVVLSAFNSAGQRCSALRVLFLHEAIAERTITMLKGAMDELCLGDPMRLATDIGPVIDQTARAELEKHIARMTESAQLLHAVALPETTAHGSFVAPHLFEIEGLSRLKREVFGPILHVVRFGNTQLDEVIDSINESGYGLTLGVHSRIDATVRYISDRVQVGNVYINRNMIGAVVGSQPFGGQGLSGTGPKAGGPHYLPAFAAEQSVSTNTAAIGGNATLLAGDED